MTPSFITDLIGKTIASVECVDSDTVRFTCSTGERYHMYHSQACCEIVRIVHETGTEFPTPSTVLYAAEEDVPAAGVTTIPTDYSHTWTTYTFILRTADNRIMPWQITWLGESDGYYSESVGFDKIN